MTYCYIIVVDNLLTLFDSSEELKGAKNTLPEYCNVYRIHINL